MKNFTGMEGSVNCPKGLDVRTVRVRRLAVQAGRVMRSASAIALSIVVLAGIAAWQVLRLVLCALFVLVEPMLRMTLVPLAVLSFAVTLIFGFLIGDPRFPRWGMLAFSVGALWMYWLFLAVMSFVVGGGRGKN
jgi:hypothetical protein